MVFGVLSHPSMDICFITKCSTSCITWNISYGLKLDKVGDIVHILCMRKHGIIHSAFSMRPLEFVDLWAWIKFLNEIYF